MEFGSWTNGLSWGASNAYDNYYLATPYIKGIQEGKYSTKELDEKVRRVLRLFYRTTMNPDKPHGFRSALCHSQASSRGRHRTLKKQEECAAYRREEG